MIQRLKGSSGEGPAIIGNVGTGPFELDLIVYSALEQEGYLKVHANRDGVAITQNPNDPGSHRNTVFGGVGIHENGDVVVSINGEPEWLGTLET